MHFGHLRPFNATFESQNLSATYLRHILSYILLSRTSNRPPSCPLDVENAESLLCRVRRPQKVNDLRVQRQQQVFRVCFRLMLVGALDARHETRRLHTAPPEQPSVAVGTEGEILLIMPLKLNIQTSLRSRAATVSTLRGRRKREDGRKRHNSSQKSPFLQLVRLLKNSCA